MKAFKYFVRPMGAASEAKAINEVAAYSRLREQYRRLRHEPVVPYGPLTPELATHIEQLRLEAAEDGRRKRSAETASDRGLLKLERARSIYALENRRCCYTTARLAQQAGEKAKHRLDAWAQLEGRAGILPEWVRWENSMMHYCGTQWSVHRRMLEQRPVDMSHVRQMYLSTERWTPTVITRQRCRWYLVVVTDAEHELREVDTNRCAAGFDLAWRREPWTPTLRVGYIADDRGEHFTLDMSRRAYERMAHADGVQSLADRELGDPLRAELGIHPKSSDGKTVHVAGESDPRAVQLVHLARWYQGQKRHAIASRNEDYLQQIHGLCRRYHTIYVERMKGKPKLVARLKTIQQLEPSAEEGAPARDQRQRVAAFTFLRRLQLEAAKYGTQVIEVDPAFTSQDCRCGHRMGKSVERERRCGACGRSWDVDHLAALNLLSRGTARIPSDEAAE